MCSFILHSLTVSKFPFMFFSCPDLFSESCFCFFVSCTLQIKKSLDAVLSTMRDERINILQEDVTRLFHSLSPKNNLIIQNTDVTRSSSLRRKQTSMESEVYYLGVSETSNSWLPVRVGGGGGRTPNLHFMIVLRLFSSSWIEYWVERGDQEIKETLVQCFSDINMRTLV